MAPRPAPRPAPPVGPEPRRPSMPRPGPVGPEPRRPSMPSYKKGGVVKKTGPALVHKGERITPAKKTKKK